MSIKITEQRKTAGLQTDVNQTFYANKLINYNYQKSTAYTFVLPLIQPSFGTLNYNLQENSSIFPALSTPCIKYNITGVTSAVTIYHTIYKLDYKMWNNYIECWNYENSPNSETNLSTNSKSIERTINKIDANGRETTEIIKETVSEKENLGVFDASKCISFETIQQKLTSATTATTFIISGTSILGDSYSFKPNEFFKNDQNKTERLFEDRGQYFITTNIVTSQPTTFNGPGTIENLGSQSAVTISTHPSGYTINTGAASGISVSGHFLTYFIIPNRPKLEEPFVENTLGTFTPTFFWSNTGDSDLQNLQITYDTTDTGFTGTVFTYNIKTENLNNSEEFNSATYGSDGWSDETTQDIIKTIKEYSVPLKMNSYFRFRIGNIKEVDPNIFGSKQQVITYSSSYTARTANITVDNNIYSSDDSLYSSVVASTSALASSDLCSEGSLSLSGTAHGSIVTGATMQLLYPSGNYIIQPTDDVGYFEFDTLSPGNYTLLTTYRGYEINSRSLTLTASTMIDVNLKLLWSNDADTFGKMANETFNYY